MTPLSLCSRADSPYAGLLCWSVYLHLLPILKFGRLATWWGVRILCPFWDPIPFPEMCFANIFSPVCGSSLPLQCLFEEKVFKICLMKSTVLIISLTFPAFCVLSKKSLPGRNFTALAPTFTFLIHCNLIFVYGSMFFSPLPLDIQLFQNHMLKAYAFRLNYLGTFVANQLTIQA